MPKYYSTFYDSYPNQIPYYIINLQSYWYFIHLIAKEHTDEIYDFSHWQKYILFDSWLINFILFSIF